MLKNLVLIKWLLLSSLLLVNYSSGQECCGELSPQRTFAPLVPVPPRQNRPQTTNNNPDWQPIPNNPSPSETQPTKPIIPNNTESSNSSCNCDFTKFDSLFVRINTLEQQITLLASKCEPVDLSPLEKQIQALQEQIEGLKHPIVVNVPPGTMQIRKEIVYLTGLECAACKKTDIEVAKLQKYPAVQLTTVIIKTKEVSVVKDLPQLIILPEKQQIVGELNVLFYLTSLMKTETTPLVPVPVK